MNNIVLTLFKLPVVVKLLITTSPIFDPWQEPFCYSIVFIVHHHTFCLKSSLQILSLSLDIFVVKYMALVDRFNFTNAPLKCK